MGRPRRRDYRGAIHHVATNGNNRQVMFANAGDRRLCIALLGETAIKYEWEVFAYTLMDTHWHAVIRTPHANLSAGMQRLNTAYSRMFNARHGRTGHSIRNRFMSVLVETDDHYRELTRYLPLNPVRAGLASHPEDWPWTSYRVEIGTDAEPIWLNASWSLRAHGTIDRLRSWVAKGMAEPDAHWTPGSDPTLTRPRPAG